MTTQRAFELHEFAGYAEASEICRHCDRGRYASIHNGITLTPTTDNRAEGEHEPEHSPLPWELSDHLDDPKNSVAFIDWVPSRGKGVTIAEVHYYDAFRRSEKPSLEEVRANAAFIVRACNEHEQRGKRIAELEAVLRNLVAADNCNYDRDVMRSEGLFDTARAVLNREGQG